MRDIWISCSTGHLVLGDLLIDEAGLTEEDQGIKVLGLNLIFEVEGLDLKEGEDRHDLTQLVVLVGVQHVKQAWHVLLDIDGSAQWLEGCVLDLPQIHEA
jgi:hypothetical protein